MTLLTKLLFILSYLKRFLETIQQHFMCIDVNLNIEITLGFFLFSKLVLTLNSLLFSVNFLILHSLIL